MCDFIYFVGLMYVKVVLVIISLPDNDVHINNNDVNDDNNQKIYMKSSFAHLHKHDGCFKWTKMNVSLDNIFVMKKYFLSTFF